jgi:hypothetical protein
VSIGYHNTSIYDHSIHQAFSKVVQRIVYKRATLDSLLESLTLRCDLTKTYLFDVINKIYIATNSRWVRCKSLRPRSPLTPRARVPPRAATTTPSTSCAAT